MQKYVPVVGKTEKPLMRIPMQEHNEPLMFDPFSPTQESHRRNIYCEKRGCLPMPPPDTTDTTNLKIGEHFTDCENQRHGEVVLTDIAYGVHCRCAALAAVHVLAHS